MHLDGIFWFGFYALAPVVYIKFRSGISWRDMFMGLRTEKKDKKNG